jgi:hypothetical protein
MADFANLLWNEEIDVQSQHGEGISRPVAGAKTKEFRIKVRQVGASPMYVYMQAESKSRALKYAKARWPVSQIEIV